MGRRARADGDRTRERILEQALPLFAERGYAGASIRTIAAAADVNVATLAYHFVDKDGLYLTVCQRLHKDLSADFPPISIGSDPRQTVRNVVATAFVFMKSHRLHIRLLIRNVLDEGKHRDEVLDTWTEPLLERGLSVVRALRPERSNTQNRLLLMTFMHTIARMVVEDPAQHARLVGVGESEAEAETVLWLQDLLCRELGLNESGD